MSRRTTSVLPLHPAPFAGHLIFAEETVGGDPFARAAGGDGERRAYLAELQSAAGAVSDSLLLELPAVAAADAASGRAPPTNLAVESRWARQADDLRRLGEASRHVCQLLLPAPAGGPAPKLPPMVFCPTRRRLYAIPCPRTLEPLTTCRDDDLLGRAGLPLYSTTRVALLHHPAAESARQRTGATRFYVASETPPPELAERGVLGLGQLRAELAATLERAAAEGKPIDPEELPAVASADGETASWWVFTDRDTPYLLTRRAEFSFDRFADHLAGRSADPAAGEKPEAAGYLFAAEGSGLDAVEILTLKLSLFSQVVNALVAYYKTLARPHLDLHPGHLAVEPGSPGDDLPQRWSFQVKLLGTSSARPRRLPQDGVVMSPPRRPLVPYCSPAVREATLIRPRTGELVIDRLIEDPGTPDRGTPGRGAPDRDGRARWQIQGRLRDPSGILPHPSARNLLELEWQEAWLGIAAQTATAHCDPAASPNPAELDFVTRPLVFEPAAVERLGRARDLSLPGVRYRIWPELNVRDDIYSLGVLLLRLLLVNDRQDLSTLGALIGSIPEASARRPEALSGEQSVDASLMVALADQAEALAPSNVFYRAEDRSPNRPNPIPEELWQQILRLAWRLVARGPGFGLGDNGAFDTSYPAIHLEQISGEIADFGRRLRLILFRRQPVHFEVHSVIAELLESLGHSG